MSPLRIIIIIVLIYIAYRLITAGRRKTRSVRGSAGKGTSSEMPASDTLEEDPICKKLVPSRQAVTMRLHGNTYYFCSKECCEIFRQQQGEQQ